MKFVLTLSKGHYYSPLDKYNKVHGGSEVHSTGIGFHNRLEIGRSAKLTIRMIPSRSKIRLRPPKSITEAYMTSACLLNLKSIRWAYKHQVQRPMPDKERKKAHAIMVGHSYFSNHQMRSYCLWQRFMKLSHFLASNGVETCSVRSIQEVICFCNFIP